MVSNKDKLRESNINNKDIIDFENKMKICMEEIIDEYSFNPKNKSGLINAIQDLMFETIIYHCEEFDKDIKKTYYLFYSDFDEPESSKAKSSLLVILGSAYSIDYEEEYVNRDISYLSSLILERNYTQS